MLDFGETEAIILAEHIKADWFLTDDLAARVFADSIGLECHGSLGIILWSCAVGKLGHQEAKAVFNKLFRQSSLWVSKDIIEEIYKALEEIF